MSSKSSSDSTYASLDSLGAIGAQMFTGLVNNAISRDNAEDQRNWQQMMWEAQNHWNDPSHMADLMRRAGLNPFTMTNAEPAGSAGTGATAETFPIENPLNALKTLAEVENLNASTGRTESETEKMYKEMLMLDLAYDRGLIEFDDYKKRLNAYWDAYGDKSEYQLDREATEAGISNTNADTSLKVSNASLSDATKNALESKLPYELNSLSASTNLSRQQALSESYKREFYTASSENQRSMAAKNYAESRLIDVKTSIESVFGALQAQANLTKTQFEAMVVIPLADSLISLQDSTSLLMQDSVRHNHVMESIQKEANQINLALMKIKENEFYHSMFKDFYDRMVPDVNKLLSTIADLL